LDAKLSHEQIAGALGISKGVVTKYVRLAAAAGLDWPTVCRWCWGSAQIWRRQVDGGVA